MLSTISMAAFGYAFLSTVVLLRLGGRQQARGRERKVFILIGWLLVGVSFTAASLLALLLVIDQTRESDGPGVVAEEGLEPPTRGL